MSNATQGPKDQGPSTKRQRRRPPLDPHGLIGNPVIVAVHGRVGDVVYKTYGAKIIVTRVPCFAGYVPTAAQRARRDRMREATAYAKRIYADPAAKAIYVAAAKTLHRQPFRLAVSDYLSGHAHGFVTRPTPPSMPPLFSFERMYRGPRDDCRPSRQCVRWSNCAGRIARRCLHRTPDPGRSPCPYRPPHKFPPISFLTKRLGRRRVIDFDDTCPNVSSFTL